MSLTVADLKAMTPAIAARVRLGEPVVCPACSKEARLVYCGELTWGIGAHGPTSHGSGHLVICPGYYFEMP